MVRSYPLALQPVWTDNIFVVDQLYNSHMHQAQIPWAQDHGGCYLAGAELEL